MTEAPVESLPVLYRFAERLAPQHVRVQWAVQSGAITPVTRSEPRTESTRLARVERETSDDN